MGSVVGARRGRAPDDDLLRALVGDEPFLHERAHADVTVVDRKRAALDASHVAPFLGWRERTVAEMRGAGVPDADDQLPHVDPASGGSFARVVVLHAGPFPCLLAVNGGSGLISPDNTDGSAARMWRLGRGAGLARADLVEWNVVPWAAGLPLRRPLARSVLARWLGVLRGPERVVLLGATARQFRDTVAATLPGVDLRTAPSPGQMARITAPDFEEQIRSALHPGR